MKLSFWVSTTNTQCKENDSKYSRVKKQDIYSWFGKAEKHGSTKMIMDICFLDVYRLINIWANENYFYEQGLLKR